MSGLLIPKPHVAIVDDKSTPIIVVIVMCPVCRTIAARRAVDTSQVENMLPATAERHTAEDLEKYNMHFAQLHVQGGTA